MSGPVIPPLTVAESDGNPTVRPVRTIALNSADFTLVDQGGGTVRIDVNPGGGTSLTDTQVGFGDSSNLLTGSSKFRYLESAGQLILTGVADDNAEFVIERSSGSTQRIGIENDSSASPKVTVSGPPNNMKPLMLENHVTDTAVTGGNQGFIFNVSNTSDQSISMINILTTDSVAYDVVFNEDSLNDYDVRIEGATDPNLFVADGSQDAIGIGTFPAAGVKLHIKDAESDNDNVVVRIQDDSADAIGDQIAIEGFFNTTEAGRVFWELRDLADGGSAFVIDVFDGTNLMEFIRMDGATGAITFNEQSEDIDFRVETNNSDSTLRIVGSQDNVGINCIPESSTRLHVKDDGSKSFTQLLESTDGDANGGPVLALWRNSPSPADGDNVGEIDWRFENDAGSRHLAARIQCRLTDVTTGTEDTELQFKVLANGTERNVLKLKESEVVVNEDSIDLDFRVESNGNVDMLKIDGGLNLVGISAAPTSGGATLQVTDNTISSYRNVVSSTTSPMTLTNADLQSQLIVHTLSSALTINLPLDGGIKGQYFQFVSTSGDVTIVPSAVAGDTINGGTASLTRATNNESYDCVCIASNTWILSNPA